MDTIVNLIRETVPIDRETMLNDESESKKETKDECGRKSHRISSHSFTIDTFGTLFDDAVSLENIDKDLSLSLSQNLKICTDPPQWWKHDQTDINRARTEKIDLKSNLGKDICAHFKKGLGQYKELLEITGITSFQNLRLWKLYQATRSVIYEDLKENMLNELYLWHGTSKDSAHKIAHQGFLRDYSILRVYGKGMYFAKNSGYSTQLISIFIEIISIFFPEFYTHYSCVCVHVYVCVWGVGGGGGGKGVGGRVKTNKKIKLNKIKTITQIRKVQCIVFVKKMAHSK